MLVPRRECRPRLFLLTPSVSAYRSAFGQAAQRPLKALLDGGFVTAGRDPGRHRYKALHLTQRGRETEHEASELKRALLARAFAAGADADAWTRIMRTIAENA